MSSSLGPASREAAVQAMQSEVLDLLVVGAGATGTGTALDAASRGLSVGLIDKGDIASGTSSKSSQLVHGGLRYLQQGNVALVRESLRERKLLLTTLAPHLVRPLPFMLPLKHRVWERLYVGCRAARLRRHRRGGRGAAASSRVQAGRPRAIPGPAAGRAHRCAPVLRRADGRRPAGGGDRAHGRSRGRPRRPAHLARRTAVGRAGGCPPGGGARRAQRRRVRRLGAERRPLRGSVGAGGLLGVHRVRQRRRHHPVEGRPPAAAPIGHRRRDGADRADRQERPVRPALADPLARRDDRHRVDGRPRRRGPDAGGHRVPARPAQRGGPPARHRRRRDLHVRGAAPPRPRPVRRRQHREGDPRASHRARGAGRAGHRRREVDHVPGDGTRPRRHGAQRVRPAGTDMPHSGAAPGGIGRRDGGRRRRPCGTRPRAGPAPGGCAGVHARRRRVRLHG